MPPIAGLGWTFNTVAKQYAEMRPGYVDELYQDLFRYSPLNASSNVLEIGIGGGQATLPVLKTGCSLTAVEYGAELAKVSQEKFRAYQNFSIATSRFEDYPILENYYDLVYSASAFHWIPETIGYAKVYQMLKSGGTFARFANHPYWDKTRPELHDAIQKVYTVYMPNSKEASEYSEHMAKERSEIAEKYGFIDICYRLYHRTRNYTAEQYTQLLATYSDHIAIEEEMRARFFAEIRQAINQAGGTITLYDTIDLELARKP